MIEEFGRPSCFFRNVTVGWRSALNSGTFLPKGVKAIATTREWRMTGNMMMAKELPSSRYIQRWEVQRPVLWQQELG